MRHHAQVNSLHTLLLALGSQDGGIQLACRLLPLRMIEQKSDGRRRLIFKRQQGHRLFQLFQERRLQCSVSIGEKGDGQRAFSSPRGASSSCANANASLICPLRMYSMRRCCCRWKNSFGFVSRICATGQDRVQSAQRTSGSRSLTRSTACSTEPL